MSEISSTFVKCALTKISVLGGVSFLKMAWFPMHSLTPMYLLGWGSSHWHQRVKSRASILKEGVRSTGIFFIFDRSVLSLQKVSCFWETDILRTVQKREELDLEFWLEGMFRNETRHPQLSSVFWDSTDFCYHVYYCSFASPFPTLKHTH